MNTKIQKRDLFLVYNNMHSLGKSLFDSVTHPFENDQLDSKSQEDQLYYKICNYLKFKYYSEKI